jgi:hypothetical protein
MFAAVPLIGIATFCLASLVALMFCAVAIKTTSSARQLRVATDEKKEPDDNEEYVNEILKNMADTASGDDPDALYNRYKDSLSDQEGDAVEYE